MPFVHVKYFRINPERAQRFHAADAQNNFLADAHFEIAAIKLGRDQAILGVVFRCVGIEQIQTDAADLQLPDFGENVATKKLDGDEQIGIALAHFANREVMKILIQTDGLLNAVLVDLLFEITVAIKESDGDEVQIEIARGFAMIARQNAQTAGIIRDRFVKTKFGREIRDRFLIALPGPVLP